MDGIVIYNSAFSNANDCMFNRSMRYIEHRHVMESLQPSPEDSILEIGCNSGAFVRKLGAYCSKVAGVDVNKDAIAKGGMPNLFCMSAETLGFPDCYFDKIVSMHTIEHIPDIEKSLREMGRVVKPGGRIVLTYPFEPVRGITALPAACFVFRNPFACRKLHLHKLNRRKIGELIEGTSLSIAEHRVIFAPWPVYLTVISKS